MHGAIGHNLPQFDFFEFFDSIVDSSANVYEKLLALIIARHVGKEGQAAYPSRARMLRQASCSIATFKRSQAVLAAFFESEARRGKATLYMPRPIVTTDEIEAAIAAARAESRYPADTGCQQNPVSDRAKSRDLSDTTVGIQEIPQKDPLKDPGKNSSDPSLRSGSANSDDALDPEEVVWGNGLQWLVKASNLPERRMRPVIGKWLKVLTHEELLHAMRSARSAKTGDPVGYITSIAQQAKAAEHAVRREKGRLVVMNGFKAELEGIFVGRDFQRSLDQIAGKIPIGISGIELETKVRAMAIEMVERVADGDRRYAAAVAQKTPSTPLQTKSFLDSVIAPTSKPRPAEEVVG